MNLLKIIEIIEINNFKNNINNNFRSGDILSVNLIINFKKIKFQNFTGIVISKKNKGINSSFSLIKIFYGIYVEKIFPIYSPLIKNLEIKFKNKFKKSKLYYLRGSKKKLLIK